MAYLGNQPVVGDSTNTFKVLDDIASFTVTFDATSSDVVSIANDTLTFRNHRFVTAQKVTYNDGGGTAIGGLADGSYFIIKEDQNTIKLASSASNAAAGTAINLTSGAAGGSHTLKIAFDGVNTKFKATHSNGTKANISRAAQLSLSINGVIQQPQDTTTPTVGYGVEADSTIVFSQAPEATDKVFGSFIGEAAASFDIADNTVDEFTANGSTTSFTLSKEIPSNNDALVTLDGVVQYPDTQTTTRAYSTKDNTITFTSAPAAGVIIQVRHIGFAGAASNEVTAFYGRTGNVQLKNTDNVAVNNLTVAGNLDVTGDITYDETVARNLNITGIATVASGIVSTGDFKIGTATTLSQDNIFTTGIITATSFVGSGSNLTGVASTENIRTNTNATFLQNVSVVGTSTVTGNIVPSSDSATDIGTNSVRFANLYVDTLYGSGANLTNLPVTAADINNLINNVAVLGFKVAANGSLAKYNLVDQVIDEYVDASGIDAGASTNEVLSGGYYSGTTSSQSTTTTTYSYTGSDTTLSLSSGQVVSGAVKLWGAAGGTDSSPGGSHNGGGGAFVSATLSFTSDGTDLIFSVGQGGLVGQKGGSGGNGGGYSGVFLGSKTHANSLLIAGAGGGAGDNTNYDGAAGGDFTTAGSAYNGGGGGSQNAGGAAGATGNATVPPTAGSALLGGSGGANETRTQSVSYNGGGIQGQEPGGYLGGGGGGGGYYGGGGGQGGNAGTGGGGGSSFKHSGSYFSGTPTATAGSGETSGGASDSNYPGGGVGTSSVGSAASGGNGAIYVNLTVTTTTAADLTLQSTDTTALSAPSTADLIMLIEDGAGTATLNTDIKGFISRDSGANFTQGTLVDEGTWGASTKRIVAFHNLDISGQPSGTSICYKITTHNQSASKETRIAATSYGWK